MAARECAARRPNAWAHGGPGVGRPGRTPQGRHVVRLHGPRAARAARCTGRAPSGCTGPWRPGSVPRVVRRYGRMAAQECAARPARRRGRAPSGCTGPWRPGSVPRVVRPHGLMAAPCGPRPRRPGRRRRGRGAHRSPTASENRAHAGVLRTRRAFAGRSGRPLARPSWLSGPPVSVALLGRRSWASVSVAGPRPLVWAARPGRSPWPLVWAARPGRSPWPPVPAVRLGRGAAGRSSC